MEFLTQRNLESENIETLASDNQDEVLRLMSEEHKKVHKGSEDFKLVPINQEQLGGDDLSNVVGSIKHKEEPAVNTQYGKVMETASEAHKSLYGSDQSTSAGKSSNSVVACCTDPKCGLTVSASLNKDMVTGRSSLNIFSGGYKSGSSDTGLSGYSSGTGSGSAGYSAGNSDGDNGGGLYQ